MPVDRDEFAWATRRAHNVRPRVALVAATLSSAVLVMDCRSAAPTNRPASEGEPARRAAASFVHCVESGTTRCVKAGDYSGGWDAFTLLAWLATGSPTSILQELESQLEQHGDTKHIQSKFVETVERYAVSIRGAECNAGETRDLDEIIGKAQRLAAERLPWLGLARSNLDQVSRELAKEAHADLDAGFLIYMECKYAPYQLYLAGRKHDDRYSIVGMTTYLPQELGGVVPDPTMVNERLRSRDLGLSDAHAPIVQEHVHPWLPFPIEVF